MLKRQAAIVLDRTYQDFEIRPWDPGDRHAVSQLTASVLAEYALQFEPKGTDRDAVEVETAYWQTGGEFWVITQHKAIVGSGGYHPSDRTLDPDGKAAELRKLFLYPSVRGLGLGRYFLSFLETAAHAKGFTELWLETSVRMTDAIALYERNGYHQPAGADLHVQRCDVIYAKRLGHPRSEQ